MSTQAWPEVACYARAGALCQRHPYVFTPNTTQTYIVTKLTWKLLFQCKAELFGSLTIYLAGKRADFLRGRFVVANWDVTDLEQHQDEIVAQGLLKGQAFKGDIGPGGHRFTSDI
jgi:hypothetical protein